MGTTSRESLVRETVVAVAAIIGLVGLSIGVRFQPVQIPGYTLMVGFVTLEGLVGTLGGYRVVLFPLYLIGLGVTSAVVGHIIRRLTPTRTLSTWRFGLAGAFVVVGVLSLLFGVLVLSRSSQLTPVVFTGVTGVVLLLVAGWLSGVLASLTR